MLAKSLAAAIGALALATPGWAADIAIQDPIDTLTFGYTSESFYYTQGTDFSDVFRFSLSDASDLTIDLSFTNSAVRKLQFDLILLTTEDSPPVNITAPSTTLSNLAAGEYSLTLTGSAIGTVGGSYHLDLVAQPVPEPQSMALLLAGVGATSLLAARRRRH